ncbi:Adenosine monophosphate-protein transferase SoFic [Limihaloglobus sulfuriphilus]|uniref:Adenosine monophosphate-protein transferase SoFic n=1 Tax=Limihaloglobus sulfuriphilus TaxID=1851148 RepID=A0A1Q2MEG1_9BACT|nr:Fic family protein [Limihaloglobus sulfuriphilus]AQQ70687.1 Adenosine monophosphate-protein transferase SoFic [Limihaloglobus sulfuriphilus]
MKPKFSITNRITNALTRIERARGFLDAANLSRRWVENMSRRALLLEAHYTTHIEGTELTLEQAEKVWRGERPEGTNEDDVRELLNYRNAFELVAGHLGGGSEITETLIREIHKRLVEGVRGGQGMPGRYRKTQNYVVNSRTKEVIYTPPPPAEVPVMMAELVSWLAKDTDIHPVLVAGIVQFQLVHIHPFVDGNGRTSRLLSTLCLYRSGYDFKRLFTISEYYDRNRMDFYKALQDVRRNSMDMTCWLDYFVVGLATQLDEVKSRGRAVIKADVIAREHGLNDRQVKALAWMLELETMRISDYENVCPGTSRRTLQRDLKKLEEIGLVSQNGAARDVYYVINE